MDTNNERNWFGRNWKWAVPTGCLTLVLLVFGFVAAIFVFVFSVMKSSDAFQHSMEAARKDAEVVAALGEPIREGWFVTGSTEDNGPGGQAQLSIPLSGPKGGGTLYVEARKSAGQWHYTTMVVELDGSGRRIDLLDDGGAAPAPPP